MLDFTDREKHVFAPWIGRTGEKLNLENKFYPFLNFIYIRCLSINNNTTWYIQA